MVCWNRRSSGTPTYRGQTTLTRQPLRPVCWNLLQHSPCFDNSCRWQGATALALEIRRCPFSMR